MAQLESFSLYTNGKGNFVLDPFAKLCERAPEIHLAAPFFTRANEIAEQVQKGKSIKLIVGLNPATDPAALKTLFGQPGVSIRYLTNRFHAKIFLFGDTVLVGSANLTNGGLMSNREATVLIDEADSAQIVDDLKAFFVELWESAAVLTDDILDRFTQARGAAAKQSNEAEKSIESAVGRVEPKNVRVTSQTKSTERVFLEDLRRMVFEQYGPSFREIGNILDEEQLHREDLVELTPASAVNRFLNWVRLENAPGDSWKEVAKLDKAERRERVKRYATVWQKADNNRVSPEFVEWFQNVHAVFGTAELLANASKDEITNGLLSLHAFAEQLRFTKGGLPKLGPEFWRSNGEDVDRVRATLDHLLFGQGDFIQRLHDILYDPNRKLKLFGRFTALELYGTIRPEECPPMNGRMAKAMRFLGYDVPE